MYAACLERVRNVADTSCEALPVEPWRDVVSLIQHSVCYGSSRPVKFSTSLSSNTRSQISKLARTLISVIGYIRSFMLVNGCSLSQQLIPGGFKEKCTQN